MDLTQLPYFIGAAALLTLAPGPDIIYVITQGVCRGSKAAITTAFGLCSGIIVHTTAAAFGVSAIFHTSALAFEALKYAGVAYLLYLAWKSLRDKGDLLSPDVSRLPQGLALFRRGFLMNLLNPKVSLFFLAFLPQFVSPAAGPVALQMILLGLIFMALSVVIFCTVGTLAGTLGNRMLQHPKINRLMGRVSALVFAGLGIRLALAER